MKYPTISSFWKTIGLGTALAVSFVVSVSAEEQFPYQAQITTKDVNVRAGQSTNFEKIGRVTTGEMVVVVAKEFSWYKIKLPSTANAYVHSKYVNDLGENVGEINVDKLNVRAGADAKFSPLGRLSKGTLVKILGKEGDWYKIEPVEGTYGWISEEFAKFASAEVPPAGVIERPTRNIYEKRRMAQQQQQAGLVTTKGVLEDLGSAAVSENIRHRVKDENNTVYYLKGYRRIIDNFLNTKVTIEGKIQDDVQADQPVLLVTKINLVL